VLAELRRDAARLRGAYPPGARLWLLSALLLDNGFQAVVCHRLAHWLRRQGVPFLGPFVARLGLLLTGADISAAAEIGPGLRISHGTGLVVGGHARIGSDALLLHGVTIGAPSEGRIGEMPVLGDRVFVGAGAAIIGAVTVGDDVVVGPNAVVTADVPAGSRVLARGGVEVTPRG
jgi:serine O-acetyltransferase